MAVPVLHKTRFKCQLPNITWIQTLGEIEIAIPLNSHYKVDISDITFNVQEKHLKVGLLDQPLIIDGDLYGNVMIDEVIPILEENDVLIINMRKETRMEKWATLFTTKQHSRDTVQKSLKSIQSDEMFMPTTKKSLENGKDAVEDEEVDPLKEYNKINQMRRSNIEFKPWKCGRPLTTKCKQLIANAYYKMSTENPKMADLEVMKKTAALLGVGTMSIRRLKSELKTHGKATTRGKTRPKAVGQRTRLQRYDEFTLSSIRRLAYNFFRRNEIPTLRKVTKAINEDENLPTMGRATVHNILRDLNFCYIQKNRRSILIDKDDIISWRRRYLRQMKDCRKAGQTVVYLGETWLSAGQTIKKTCKDVPKSGAQELLEGLAPDLKDFTGKEDKLLILHAGCENGFIPKCELFLKPKKTNNGHEEMDGPCFQKWFSECLLKNIPAQSVIVLDNASYHSVKQDPFPTLSWKKEDIRKWLTQKKISWKEELVKSDLLEGAEHLRRYCDEYVVDAMARNAGHTILRLPPYHYELNAIELVWANIKNMIGCENMTMELQEVESHAKVIISNIQTDFWSKCNDHVMSIEEELWMLDGLVDDAVDRLGTSADQSSSSSEDSDECGDLDPLQMSVDE